MGERTIILHYHLFKNAGTTVDSILKRNFGEKWVTREFPATGGNNTALVEQWITETPEAIAYSSHTMMGPIPQVEGVKVISIMLLRDPIDRIKSAYRFERTQEADTWGARLAKEHDFAGYVHARLARTGDRQCRNFQTHQLASLVPGAETELARAKTALAQLTVVGRVEAFDEAMERLAISVRPIYPEFELVKKIENSSNKSEGTEISGNLLDRIIRENSEDINLVAYTTTHSTT